MWSGDRWDYVFWLRAQLFPDDWKNQARVSWAVYSEGLPLTYEPETDLTRIRVYLATESALGKPDYDKNN